MPFALTARMVEIYRLHKDTCIINGIGQTSFFHRHPEGILSAVPGFPNNTDYQTPGPRTQDNPTDPVVLIWMTWVPFRMKGGTDGSIGGDARSSRAWLFRMHGQSPVIDDNGNQVLMTDEDFGLDPYGNKFRIENPALAPDGSAWAFEIVRFR